VRLIPFVLALFFAGSAMADDWREYDNAEYSFAIHFPLDPTPETATYRTADGRSFEAHTFSVQQETGVFKVTVVEMPGGETGEDALVVKDAAKTAAEGGVVKFDIPHRVRAVYGRQLGIAGANGDGQHAAAPRHISRLRGADRSESA
jgi:hypothetical protein